MYQTYSYGNGKRDGFCCGVGNDISGHVSIQKGVTGMNYFDIHNHMLPGVDDGASNMEESLAMLKVAYNEGTRFAILTPHYTRGKNKCTRQQLKERFSQLQQEVAKQFPDLTLYLGNEILYEDGVVEDLKEGLIQTMNDTKYVLVEFNIRISYNELYQAIRKITNARFRPIIAHVERYRCLFKHIERIDELVSLEATLQMNISSVYGGFLDENARWCKQLVKEGYISFFGTDAHDLDDRAPYINDYVGWVKKKCGEDFLQQIFWDNPKRMVENQYIID
jgi:protein-tyrosine phosphatase